MVQVDLSQGSPDLEYSIGWHGEQGRRTYMEDRTVVADLTSDTHTFPGSSRVVYAAVFDGHGGPEASEHLAQRTLPCLLACERAQHLECESGDHGEALRSTVASMEQVRRVWGGRGCDGLVVK